MVEFTEEEMAGLSDEERAAIMDEEGEAQDLPGDEGGNDDQDGDSPGETEGEDSGGGDTDLPEAASSPQQDREGAPQIPFVPVLPVDTSRLDDISSQLETLNQQLSDGDLDLVEYTKLRDPLIREQTQIELTQHFNEQQQALLWKHEQTMFFSKNEDYRTDPVLNGALRAAFKQIDTEENANKSGYDLLLEAKAQVEKRFGGGGKASTPSDKKPQAGSQQAPRRTTPARDDASIPQTLAETIPAAENPTSSDEFSHLDNLTGLEFEQALAKLPKELEERYLRGQ